MDTYTNIEVCSRGKYKEFSPFVLRNDKGQIIENVWQFSKVYRKSYKTNDARSLWYWGEEIHVTESGSLTNEYYKWRFAGKNHQRAVRYPMGREHKSECLCILATDKFNINESDILSYTEARDKLYFKEYKNAILKLNSLYYLLDKVKKGENIMLVDIDGPHEESMDYYKDKYNVPDNFIENDSVLATKFSINLFKNDAKHSWGHAFIIASTLLELL